MELDLQTLALYLGQQIEIKCTISSIKLILRPLSDITEEEISDLYILLEFDKEISERQYPELHKTGGKKITKEDDCVIIENDNDWGIEVRINKYGQALTTCKDNREDYSGEEQAVIFKYLLSKGFDLFNLIEQNLAIDKTKLNDSPSNKE